MLRMFSYRARSERGLAAVEAGLVSTFMMPLLAGVLLYGYWFWQAQHVDAYAPHIDPSAIAPGPHSCTDLISAVKSAVANNLTTVTGNNLSGFDPNNDISVKAIQPLVNGVPDVTTGVQVQVTVTIPVVAAALGQFLPDHGAVVTTALLRLQNVSVSTANTSLGCTTI